MKPLKQTLVSPGLPLAQASCAIHSEVWWLTFWGIWTHIFVLTSYEEDWNQEAEWVRLRQIVWTSFSSGDNSRCAMRRASLGTGSWQFPVDITKEKDQMVVILWNKNRWWRGISSSSSTHLFSSFLRIYFYQSVISTLTLSFYL